MDHHRKGNEKEFGIGKPVLVFQTQMGSMPGKLWFRWIGSYWIVKEFKGIYQLGTLAGDVLDKWVNGFQLKPYKEPMPVNPFKAPEQHEGNEDAGDHRTAEIRGQPDITGQAPELTGPANRQNQPGSEESMTPGVGK